MNSPFRFFRKLKTDFKPNYFALLLILFSGSLFSQSSISSASTSNNKTLVNTADETIFINSSGAVLTSVDNTLDQDLLNAKIAKINAVEKSRIWLNLTNTEGAFKQLLVGYITGATNDYEDTFDAISYDANPFVDFYSVLQERNLTIQGRALPFNENDVVPLGYRSAISGSFSISIFQTDGSLTTQGIYLEDKLLGKTADLRIAPYLFSTEIGVFKDRFVLKYKNNLSTNDFNSNEKNVLVYCVDKQIKLNSFSDMIDEVTVYDLLGRKLYSKDKVANKELTISDLGLNNHFVIVQTLLQNGLLIYKKIVL